MPKGSEWITLIAIPIFLMMIATHPLPFVKPLDGKCFPDYRPGFGCYVFEKLP